MLSRICSGRGTRV